MAVAPAQDWNQGGGGWDDNFNSGASGFASQDARADEWNDNIATGASGFASQDARTGEWDDNFSTGVSGFSPEVAGADGHDSACHNCGQDGHMSRECPEPKKMGACFNCGEDGHSKADCPLPRKFTGTCRECNEEGHQARDCPMKVKVCKQCLQEGHETIECKNAKVIDTSKVPDMTEDEAWAMLKKASDEKDLDDFRDGVKILSKAVPTLTYVDMEKEFRKRGFKVYLIGLVKNIEDTWTIVNLQGEVGKKYSVGYFLSEKPQRPKLVDVWPESAAANLERLADAGLAVDRGIPKCSNCGQMGHVMRRCPEEIVPATRVTVSCKLCGEEGHRVRDCKQERQKPRDPRACKVCEATDHIARDCPDKPKRACHNCGSEEHMARDCEVIKCRNCDEIGHESRDCPAPKDWSRVKCRNCGEMGHTVKRCKQPIKEDENDYPQPVNDGFDSGPVAGGDDWNTAGVSGHNDWEAAPAVVAADGGADWNAGGAVGGSQW
ncbi:hypothetical protein DV738_g719, partial [Chaetothyriales sp. CBS 135597]